MKLTYQITLADWKAAIRLHACQSIGRRIHFFIYDYVFPSLAIVGIAFFVYVKAAGDSQGADNLLVPVITLVAIAIIVPVVRQYAVRKSFRGMFPPSESGPGYSLDIDDERILSIRTGIGEATYYWFGICAVTQNKKVILLYLSKVLFLMIPIHVISPEQLVELSRIIASRPQKGKPC